MQTAIALCKQRLPLPDLLVRLGLFQNPPGPGSHPCPLHRERKGAAFSMHRPKGAWLWKCHGKCAASGDEISLLRFVEGTNNRSAIQRYKELCGHSGGYRIPVHKPLRQSTPEYHPPLQPMIQLPERLHSGAYADFEQVARLYHHRHGAERLSRLWKRLRCALVGRAGRFEENCRGAHA